MIMQKKQLIHKKTACLMLALNTLFFPQPTYAIQARDAVFIIGTTILGAFGISYGISYGVTSAEHQQKNNDVALIANVESIDPYKKFSDIFYVIQSSKNNKTDTTLALAYYFASKNSSLKSLKYEIEQYAHANEQKVKQLTHTIALWKSEKKYDEQFIKRAEHVLNKLESAKLLQQVTYLSNFIQQEETFLEAFDFIARIKNKSYNYVNTDFPLVKTVAVMHDTCEVLQKKYDEVVLARESHRNEWNSYTQLIEDIQTEQTRLQQSIQRISSSYEYGLEKEKKKLHDIKQQELENEKIKLKAELLRQEKYQSKNIHLQNENQKIKTERDSYKHQLTQKDNSIIALKKEIDRLKENIMVLEQELLLLKSKSEQDIQKITETEKKLAALREKLEEFLRKLKHPPFNPQNENLSQEARYYINVINLANFEVV